eukprot:11495962-Alexandrium_andersonii.AAC.1
MPQQDVQGGTGSRGRQAAGGRRQAAGVVAANTGSGFCKVLLQTGIVGVASDEPWAIAWAVCVGSRAAVSAVSHVVALTGPG